MLKCVCGKATFTKEVLPQTCWSSFSTIKTAAKRHSLLPNLLLCNSVTHVIFSIGCSGPFVWGSGRPIQSSIALAGSQRGSCFFFHRGWTILKNIFLATRGQSCSLLKMPWDQPNQGPSYVKAEYNPEKLSLCIDLILPAAILRPSLFLWSSQAFSPFLDHKPKCYYKWLILQ